MNFMLHLNFNYPKPPLQLWHLQGKIRIKLELINNKRRLCPRTPVFVGLWASPRLRLMIAGEKCFCYRDIFYINIYDQKLFKVSDVQVSRFSDFQIFRLSDSQFFKSQKNNLKIYRFEISKNK